MRYSLSRLSALFLFLALCLVGPTLIHVPEARAAVLQGVIATVNGEPITLREAEARRALLFGGFTGNLPPEGNQVMREQYLYVVKQMAEELVICQFMAKKRLGLEEGELEEEEAFLRTDYPPGAFEQMLLEEGMNEDIWREQLRRSLIVRKFIAMFIRPEVLPTPEEMLAYYSEHKDEFFIPEQWHFIQILGLDQKEVERARNSFLQSRNATDVQRNFMVTMHDVQSASEMLPEAFREELDKMAAWTGGPIRPHEGEFRTFILVETIPSTQMDANTVTARVEQALMEENLSQAYQRHVEQLLSRSTIRIAEALLRDEVNEAKTDPGHPASAQTGDKTLPESQDPAGNSGSGQTAEVPMD